MDLAPVVAALEATCPPHRAARHLERLVAQHPEGHRRVLAELHVEYERRPVVLRGYPLERRRQRRQPSPRYRLGGCAGQRLLVARVVRERHPHLHRGALVRVGQRVARAGRPGDVSVVRQPLVGERRPRQPVGVGDGRRRRRQRLAHARRARNGWRARGGGVLGLRYRVRDCLGAEALDVQLVRVAQHRTAGSLRVGHRDRLAPPHRLRQHQAHRLVFPEGSPRGPALAVDLHRVARVAAPVQDLLREREYHAAPGLLRLGALESRRARVVGQARPQQDLGIRVARVGDEPNAIVVRKAVVHRQAQGCRSRVRSEFRVCIPVEALT